MQCNIMENTLIKLTLHDETKKRANDSQIVRAKENLKLSHGGSSNQSFSFVIIFFLERMTNHMEKNILSQNILESKGKF